MCGRWVGFEFFVFSFDFVRQSSASRAETGQTLRQNRAEVAQELRDNLRDRWITFGEKTDRSVGGRIKRRGEGGKTGDP